MELFVLLLCMSSIAAGPLEDLTADVVSVLTKCTHLRSVHLKLALNRQKSNFGKMSKLKSESKSTLTPITQHGGVVFKVIQLPKICFFRSLSK